MVMLRNGDVRRRTSANFEKLISLASLSLESQVIKPQLGEVMNNVLDDFLNAKESSNSLKSKISEIKHQRPIMDFIDRFNRTAKSGKFDYDKAGSLSPHARDYIPNTVLVKFKPKTRSENVTAVCKEVGMVVQKRYLLTGIYKMSVSENKVMETIEMLSRNENVEYAEPDYILKIYSKIPDDPDFSNLWGIHNTGQDGGTPDADIDAPEAWDITTGSSEVVVAVIDSGVNYDHEDLSSNMWKNTGEIPDNGIDDDGNGYIDDYLGWDFANDDKDPMDDNDHGTHCSGTIGGIGNNDVGVAGVNWTIRIMPLKFLDSCGSGSTSDAIEAIEYATMMGVPISSNSWGGGAYSEALIDAIEVFGNSGGLFIAAAGNDGEDNDETPHYPSSYNLPNIIAVAATDRNDTLADFSCYGKESVDVAAPGVDIYSTVISGYDYMSGTSMATPCVSGIAALLKGRNPSWGYPDIKNAIEQSVDPKASLDGMVATGGRVNAYGALRAGGSPGYPVVTTSQPTGITSNSAQGGGVVTSDGDADVTVRGVCWSTSANPTTANDKTTDGTGTGSFTSSITGLSPGTTYHVRAYATNSEGTSYGDDVPFTTSTVAPTVSTTAVSSVTSTSAASGGNVTSDGGATVTARGVCWSTSANPTTADDKTTDGTGTGSFTSSITGLSPGTTYHVRAYATNSEGTSYGDDVPFTTSTVAPTVSTTAVSSVTSTSAASGGNVTSDGGATVTARGVCWSTSANPTTADDKTTDGTGTGSFTSSITGLSPGTTYHVRAYATNLAGTGYGDSLSFTTSYSSTLYPIFTTSWCLISSTY